MSLKPQDKSGITKTNPILSCLILIIGPFIVYGLFRLLLTTSTPSTPSNPSAVQSAAPKRTNPWPQEPDGWAGIKWGTTRKDFRKAMPKAKCIIENRCEREQLIDGWSFKNYFIFINGRFMQVEIPLQADFDEFDQILPVFRRRFGPPHSDKTALLQNGFGATFENKILSWSGRTASIVIRKYDEDLSVGTAIIGLNTTPREQRLERAKELKKAASDLDK